MPRREHRNRRGHTPWGAHKALHRARGQGEGRPVPSISAPLCLYSEMMQPAGPPISKAECQCQMLGKRPLCFSPSHQCPSSAPLPARCSLYPLLTSVRTLIGPPITARTPLAEEPLQTLLFALAGVTWSLLAGPSHPQSGSYTLRPNSLCSLYTNTHTLSLP